MSGEMVNQSGFSDSGPIPESSTRIVMLSICSIELKGKKSKGTGFLLKVQANHTTAVKGFLANNHVITDKDIRHKGTCVLKFDHLPTPLEIKVSLKDCEYTYFSDVSSMDATFIALPGSAINQLDDAGAVWLSIHPDDAMVGEKVFTIQHPTVQSKGNLSFPHGEVKGTESQTGKTHTYIFVKHSAETDPDSSGSPVMTFDGRLIGLHRCSVSEATNGATNARCILKAIIEDFAELVEDNPDIARSISETSSKSIRCCSCSSSGGDPMDIEGTDSTPTKTSSKQAASTTKKQADFKIEDFDEKTLKNKTRKCTTRFSSFDPKGFIFNKLAAEGILTNRKQKELNDIVNQEDRWNALMHHLFDFGHPQTISIFLKALRDSDEQVDNDILKDILNTEA